MASVHQCKECLPHETRHRLKREKVVKKEDTLKGTSDKLIELILRNREGKIKVKPGYDGVYGVAQMEEKQKSLF